MFRNIAQIGNWLRDPYYKRIGDWNLLQAEQGFQAAATEILTKFESWSFEEVIVLTAGALNDIHNPGIHALVDFYVVYGRKPE
ncbi:hypothetical protein VTN96DRAFT_2627 [Rasamsonia emersonii]